MSKGNKTSFVKTLLYTCVIIGALVYDVGLGDSPYPILTLVMCGIVILYERVSPYIYIAR